MPNSVSTIYRYQGAKGGSQMAVQAALSNAEPIQGVAQQQIVASFETTLRFDYPAFVAAGFATTAQRVYLSTFPDRILIPANTRASVLCGAMPHSVGSGLLLGGPAFALAAHGQTIDFVLTPGTAYDQFALTLAIQGYAPAAQAAQTIYVTVWALLVCSR